MSDFMWKNGEMMGIGKTKWLRDIQACYKGRWMWTFYFIIKPGGFCWFCT